MSTHVDDEPSLLLTATDLCDRCSARATVETMTLAGASLLWCGHHFGRHAAALVISGATVVIDERVAIAAALG